MEPKIDWQAALNGSRPVTTRDGRKVTIYYTEAPDEYPIYGRIKGAPEPSYWRRNGTYLTIGGESNRDLIQPPRQFKYERWVNVYEDGPSLYHHLTKEIADLHKRHKRIACVKVVIEGEEGEGLE